MALQLPERPKIYTSESAVPQETRVVDTMSVAIDELFFARNPHLKSGTPEALETLRKFKKADTTQPIWIYYPWRGVVVKTVPEREYFELRTNRNRNIITEDEQRAYRDATVGIAGLSVGSSSLAALTMTGGPQKLKIADPDTIEITNLNRIRAALASVGRKKTHVAAELVWDVDPFADIEIWDEGVATETLEGFISKPRLSVFVDAMDAIPLKIRARHVCKQHGVPLLMATDNGDGAILDVERFDQDKDYPIFHGLIADIKDEDAQSLNFREWLALATKIVGPEHLPLRMQESLLSVGKKISSVPQIGTAASIAGAAISFALRRIVSSQSMPSGRYTVSLESEIVPNYDDPKEIEKRARKAAFFKKHFLRR